MARLLQYCAIALSLVYVLHGLADAAIVGCKERPAVRLPSDGIPSLVHETELAAVERQVGYPIKYCDELGSEDGSPGESPTPTMDESPTGSKSPAPSTTRPSMSTGESPRSSGGEETTPEPTSSDTEPEMTGTPSTVTVDGIKAGEDYGTCDAHPAKFPGLVPVIVKQWTYKKIDNGMIMEPLPNCYLPRYEDFWYRPVEDTSSTKYKGLDLFYSHWDFDWDNEPDAITLELHRPARLYFVIGAIFVERSPSEGTMAGYKSEGWVEVNTIGQETRPSITYGIVRQQTTSELPVRAYVFSKQVSGRVTLPGGSWFSENVRGLKSPWGRYAVFIAEEDGSPSKEPQSPPGIGPIKAGGRCPQELHDTWKTGHDDPSDPEISGMTFSTWHPMWDPCYRCGYDHEHGSNAGALMGLNHPFDYIALKNRNQDEPHTGFKTIVFRSGRYLVAYDFHFVLGISRRFFNTHHSGALTIVDAASKELMAKLQMKVDYGRRKVRTPTVGSMNFDPADDALEQEEKDNDLSRRSRLFNVMRSENRAERDPRYGYNDLRDGKDYRLGEYEQWRSVFICMTESQDTNFRVDIRDPATAIRTVNSKQSDPLLQLGRAHDDGSFSPSKSLNRRLEIENLQLSKSLCKFTNSDTVPDGVFYTDPFGKEVYSTPGPTRVRQFIKPGFSMTFEKGDYQVDDLVRGMHANFVGKSRSMTFVDNGQTIDPMKN